MKSFIEDVFIDGTHMYDTDKIEAILKDTPKCTSKWCQTCRPPKDGISKFVVN